MFHKLKFPKPITTEQNPRTSTRLFERACDLDQTTGCHYYASALLKPGADQNLHKAAEAFGKACDKGWFFLLRPEVECRFGALVNDNLNIWNYTNSILIIDWHTMKQSVIAIMASSQAISVN